jgi:HlyD family secretion protein
MSTFRAGSWIFSLLLLAGAVAAGYWAYQRTRPAVEVTRVAIGPVVQAFYSTGTISAVREYPVRAQVGGIVTDLRVDKGSAVKQGEVIAKVADPTLDYAVARAEAELAEKLALADESTSPVLAEIDAQSISVTALLEIAEREFDRISRMRESDASTSVDLDRALDRVKTLTSEKASLKARRETRLLELRRMSQVAAAALSAARAESEKQWVRAPVDGVVLDRPTPAGTRVDAQMNNELMTIADVSQEALVMRAQVDEEDVATLHDGQTVKLTLYTYGSKVFTGAVVRIYDKADPERRTFEVDITFDRQNRRIAAGMTGEIAFIEAEKTQARTLPTEAVQVRIRPRQTGDRDDGSAPTSAAAEGQADEVRETVVWTVRNSQLYPVVVTLGLRGTQRVEVLSGLSDDDIVVLTAIDGRTAPGTAVRVVLPAPQAPRSPATGTPPAEPETPRVASPSVGG